MIRFDNPLDYTNRLCRAYPAGESGFLICVTNQSSQNGDVWGVAHVTTDGTREIPRPQVATQGRWCQYFTHNEHTGKVSTEVTVRRGVYEEVMLAPKCKRVHNLRTHTMNMNTGRDIQQFLWRKPTGHEVVVYNVQPTATYMHYCFDTGLWVETTCVSNDGLMLLVANSDTITLYDME